MSKTIKSFLLTAITVVIFSACGGSSEEIDTSLIPVESNDKWGYVDEKGNFGINPQFEDAYFFCDGLARVQNSEGQWGYINKKGEFVINAKYLRATDFSDGLAFVVAEGEAPTCINKKGEKQFVLQDAQFVFPYHEGLALVYVKEKGCGYVDKKGNYAINPQFDYAGYFHDGLARFENGDQWGFVDKKGNYAINPQFDYAGDFHDGLAPFKNGKQCGFVDKKGKIVINPQFYDTDGFSEGLAPVMQNDKAGYIDKDGKFVINPQFENASRFIGDIAFVESGRKWGFIGKDGQYKVNPQFESLKDPVKNFRQEGVETDFFDLSAFTNKFFDANQPYYFENLLGITLKQLNETQFGKKARTENQKALSYSVPYSDRRIDDVIGINAIRFFSNNDFYTFQNWSKEYNMETTVECVLYNISLSNYKYGAFAAGIENYLKDKYQVKELESPGGDDSHYFEQSGKNIVFAISDGSGDNFIVMTKAYYDKLMSPEPETEEFDDVPEGGRLSENSNID